MPHIVLHHSPGLELSKLLPALSDALQAEGFPARAIKAYSLPLGEVWMPDASAGFLPLTLRVLDRPDRTDDVLSAWLDRLYAVAMKWVGPDACVTAEIAILPRHYRSPTA